MSLTLLRCSRVSQCSLKVTKVAYFGAVVKVMAVSLVIMSNVIIPLIDSILTHYNKILRPVRRLKCDIELALELISRRRGVCVIEPAWSPLLDEDEIVTLG
jgi:hypothetical protein